MSTMSRLRNWFKRAPPPPELLPFDGGPAVVVKRCKTCGQHVNAWRTYADGHVACIPCARSL